MQLKRFALLAAGTLPALPAAEPSPAETPSMDDLQLRPWDVTIKTALYTQQDQGGIEEVDEDATVFETAILATRQMTDTGTLGLRLLGDLVSAASIERAHNADFRAAQSGASGNYRYGLAASWSERGEALDWHAGAQIATEYAYTSLGASGGLTWNLPGRNTALSADLQVFMDTVKEVRFDGQNDGTDGRDTYTVDVSWHQIWSPYDITDLSLSHTQQSGYLQTSYNSVFSDVLEYSEELPDSRSRNALTLRWRHSLSENNAIELGGRYYRDDWEVSSLTADLRFSQYLNHRRLLLEPHLRLHQQDAAKYYQEHWDEPLPEYRTSDPDLGEFTGIMAGLKASFLERSFFGKPCDYDVSLYYYDRDNGLSMQWIMLGLHLEL